MQSSVQKSLTVKSSTSAVLVCQTFQIPLVLFRENTQRTCVCENETVAETPASIAVGSLTLSALLRWHLLPPTSPPLTDTLTAGSCSKGKPAICHLLVTLNTFQKGKTKFCPGLDEF